MSPNTRTQEVLRPIALAAALALLAGCGSLKNEKSEPSMGAPVDGTVQHSFESSAVVEAWSAAEVARQRGDFTAAFRHLRKALEIEPKDPVVWSRLAEMALRLNKPEPSEKYAERSTQLAAGNSTLIYRNWLIIQRARELNHDIAGAEVALRNANQFRP